VKVQTSDHQVHLLIQACKDWSKGWWMKLKIYGPEGYLVLSTFELMLARSKKAIEFRIPMPKVPTVSAN
jgi:hypothetical protein